jgi:hypothetical protein
VEGILEFVFRGLFEWIYGMFIDTLQMTASYLMDVFTMDMAYFERTVPVSREVFLVAMAIGWALLIGNLAFQAAKSMMGAMGFEGEDPKLLFMRTAVFA